MKETRIRKNYKDSLFRMIFREKTALLNLYNAINDSDYNNPDDLEVNTIENYIYMGLKNDVSFLLDCCINLYEAQSTLNPNMPLRGLFYLSNLYQGYIDSRKLDIYSSLPLQLPTPKYIVFYNGVKEEQDIREMRLSDSFITGKRNDYCLECTATLLNINLGHNQQIMKNCRELYEYSYLIAAVRSCLAEGFSLADAMDIAVNRCIKEGILETFLRMHRGEVKNMILSEYNEEFHIKCEKEISFSEGRTKGLAEGIAEGLAEGLAEGESKKLIQLVCRKLQRGKNAREIAEDLEEPYDIVEKICQAAEGIPGDDYNAVYNRLHNK